MKFNVLIRCKITCTVLLLQMDTEVFNETEIHVIQQFLSWNYVIIHLCCFLHCCPCNEVAGPQISGRLLLARELSKSITESKWTTNIQADFNMLVLNCAQSELRVNHNRKSQFGTMEICCLLPPLLCTSVT
jgi:hypothetical protein